jgi:ppGpp synthetase/RelA/SpoT-type nucleotidyltranferase
VEIQVRTALQDGWAQLIERFADWWGRGIRYGDLPIDPDREVAEGWTRRSLFETFMEQSERIDQLEQLAASIHRLETDFKRNPPTPEELQQIEEAKEVHRIFEAQIREMYLRLGLMK